MFAKAHLQTALLLVQAYKGEMPFVHYAKQYFSSHKKHGSRDRKQILQLCYAYFRLGHALPGWPAEKRMVTGLFLCSTEPNALLQALEPGWNDHASLPLEKKCELAGCTINDLTIFPFPGQLSNEPETLAFSVSHLAQPDLFKATNNVTHYQALLFNFFLPPDRISRTQAGSKFLRAC